MHDIRTKIDAIRQIPDTVSDASPDEIAAEIEALSGFKPGAEFGEHIQEAAEAAQSALLALIDLHRIATGGERRQIMLAAAQRRRQEDGSSFPGVDIDRAHAMADDADAVQHFRDIVAELLNTRTTDEIRLMLEEEFANAGLSQWGGA